MEIHFLSVIAMEFILGIKHAIEPDHVMPFPQSQSQQKTLAGVFWGIGHTFTLFTV
ncbi:hypothetical protein [Effusibacillus dendaii]|uniref:Nickel/cobalt efflux system n=1 Tax=Effusibacillus dendaii TaxID=2743772 RepID=A0A7I8DHC1_9BACL|nr:hypothetical protein [Effusibacillus dendaii]BCJ88409.1 hypothetical protein skT53_33940 [Effusibacillus dendaii]